MQRLWSQIENISRAARAHFRLRRSVPVTGMPAASGFFGLDYRLGDCVGNNSENILAGLPKAASLKQQI